MLDDSSVQLKRSEDNIPTIDQKHRIQADIRETPFKNGTFDTVVIKMGVHEIPKEEQLKLFLEMNRILKPEGKLVIWELALDKETQNVFRDVIRMKDKLAGFDKLVQNRYFPRHDDLTRLFKKGGFIDVEDYYEFYPRLSTLVRKDELVSKEHKQLENKNGTLTKEEEVQLKQLGKERAKLLTEYARKRVPVELRKKMNYKDFGDDIQFSPKKIIMLGYKR